jgi:DNA repair protein RecN (Recombination protein N)
MLSSLCVRHLAVVDDIELNFGAGMTSLTGETGAGKSILVDALGLVLGDRADSSMVRHGYDRAEIEASFILSENKPLADWLIEQQLDDDDLCHLRRTISKDGPSRAYINGRSVPASQLRQISELTIDIHGQHAHQSLLRSETQRLIIDTAADNKALLKELAVAYKEWQQTKKQVQELQQQAEQRTAQLDLLSYQVNELESLELTEDSVAELIKEQQLLAHASQLLNVSQSALFQLFEQEDGSAYQTVSQSLKELETLADIEPKFSNIIELINSVIVQLDETASELRHYIDRNELDPSRLDEIESRLSQLHAVARKHHVEIEALPEHFLSLCEQLDAVKNSAVLSEQLEQKLDSQEQHCRQLCQQISARRQAAAKPLANDIIAAIQQLAMHSGTIEITVKPMPDNHFNETGADTIQFLVSTNPGQTAGDLAKVASGGELARISLAIQVVTAGTRSVPSLVFDEVDVGIGGGIAEIVGKHLRQLAKSRQVICITHLPQVAAQAHQQLQVSKSQSNDSTHIELTALSTEQRIEEIARMLGGIKLTEKTRSHAQEMLEQAMGT